MDSDNLVELWYRAFPGGGSKPNFQLARLLPTWDTAKNQPLCTYSVSSSTDMDLEEVTRVNSAWDWNITKLEKYIQYLPHFCAIIQLELSPISHFVCHLSICLSHYSFVFLVDNERNCILATVRCECDSCYDNYIASSDHLLNI